MTRGCRLSPFVQTQGLSLRFRFMKRQSNSRVLLRPKVLLGEERQILPSKDLEEYISGNEEYVIYGEHSVNG